MNKIGKKIIEKIKQVEKKLREFYLIKYKSSKIEFDSYFVQNEQEYNKVDNISNLMKKMLFHAQNSAANRKMHIIKFNDNKQKLAKILYNFVPKEILKYYQNSQEIYNKIETQNIIGLNKNCWTGYAKTIYEVAYFLKDFNSLDEFITFLDKIQEKTPYLLPTLLTCIYGFGPALSADFLKEFKYTDLVKPDTHIKNVLNDVFKIKTNHIISSYLCIQDICKGLKWSAYKLDKIFYLYCTLNFYQETLRYKENKQLNKNRRNNLIKYLSDDSIDEIHILEDKSAIDTN